MRKLTIKRVEMFVRVEEEKCHKHWWISHKKLEESTISGHYIIALSETLQVKKPKDIERLRYCLKFIIEHRKIIDILMGKEPEDTRMDNWITNARLRGKSYGYQSLIPDSLIQQMQIDSQRHQDSLLDALTYGHSVTKLFNQ